MDQIRLIMFDIGFKISTQTSFGWIVSWVDKVFFFFVPHCPETLRYAKVWRKDVVGSLTLAYDKVIRTK